MQFMLWVTVVVTIIYTMLTRAETGSSLARTTRLPRKWFASGKRVGVTCPVWLT